jgi:DNA-binding NarL/FixJ family response regulator
MIVDDHPLVRHGLAEIIGQDRGFSVCAQAGTPGAAVRLLEVEEPDLVIVDLCLGRRDGVDLIKEIRARRPETLVVVLTMHEESFHAERALRAGAQGYLTKQEASCKVVEALRQVQAGGLYVSERLSPQLLQRLISGKPGEDEPVTARLSDRELQVFLMIGKGYSTQEIADDLSLSVKTIETYRGHIKRKLDLGDARELMKYAIVWALNREHQ